MLTDEEKAAVRNTIKAVKQNIARRTYGDTSERDKAIDSLRKLCEAISVSPIEGYE